MNPSKFQAMIFDKRKGNHTNQIINIDQKEIKAVTKNKILQIEIDDELSFNHHINNIYKFLSNQPNTIIRLNRLLRFKERKVLVNTFVISNFNYCSIVYNFSSTQSLKKIENLQKRGLRFLLRDYGSTYEDLIKKSGCPNMNLTRQKRLCMEI